jgi:hypothetical protein
MQADDRAAATSVVTFGAGATALAGAVLVLLTKPHSSSQTSGVMLAPMRIGDGGGATLSVRF